MTGHAGFCQDLTGSRGHRLPCVWEERSGPRAEVAIVAASGDFPCGGLLGNFPLKHLH